MYEQNLNKSGKTFRRLSHHVTEDSLLKISCERNSHESINLYGNTFFKDVSYSMKKKNRWMLSELLSKGIYDEDIPIVFSKHQTIMGQKPIKTIFMFDSLLEAEFGSKRVSNDRLDPGGFSWESKMKEAENEFQPSKRELKKFEKSKVYDIKPLKKSRKDHRPILRYVPEPHEKYPFSEAHLLNLEARQTLVTVDEYVHINNVSRVNIIQPPPNHKLQKQQDHRKCSIKYDPCDLYDVYSDAEEEQFNVDYVEETPRAFMLQDSDFVVSHRPTKTKKIKRPRRNNPYKMLPERCEAAAESPLNEISIGEEDKSSFVVDLNRDIIPFIVIELPYESFLVDLGNVARIHQCWISETSPRMVLVGLDKSEDTPAKNYIVLTPTIGTRDELVSLKMSFNMTHFDFNEALDHKFTTLVEFVEFIQSTLTPTKEISFSTKTQLLDLDRQREEICNVWQTKKWESRMEIFQLHNEWKNHVFTDNDIGSIVSCLNDEQKYTMDICQVCFSEFPDDELITIHNCNHKMCEKCLCSHLILRLETGLQRLNCPGTECQTQLDCALVLSLVSYKRYCKRLGNLETNVLQKIGTLCFNCRAVTITNDVDSETSRPRFNYRCSCKNIICNLCGHNQHWPSSCSENKRYMQKLKELKDMEVFSQRPEPLLIDGINCPRCFIFIVKDNGCNDMSCICGARFCWLCGDAMNKGNHKSSFPCTSDQFSRLITLDLSFSLPDSGNLRPKLYVLSLNQRINNLSCRIFRFFKSIDAQSLFDSKMNSSHPIYDIESFKNQIVQLNNVTEYLFVKAYQVPANKHAHLQQCLKKSAFMMIYFKNQIDYYVETIFYLIKMSRNDSSATRKAKDHYIKFIDMMSYVKKYMDHMHLVL